jgi:hypothetical protein
MSQTEQQICQSCMMPLPNESSHGTNEDGSYNADYCHHCYQNGAFTSDVRLEQMIENCVPVMAHMMDADKARAYLAVKLPTLKRWG